MYENVNIQEGNYNNIYPISTLFRTNSTLIYIQHCILFKTLRISNIDFSSYYHFFVIFLLPTLSSFVALAALHDHFAVAHE